MEKIIKIEGVDYKVKRTMRSIMMFEQITGRSVSEISDKIGDILTFYFCILKACNKQTMANVDFDAFVDLIDEHEEVFEQISEALNDKEEKKA